MACGNCGAVLDAADPDHQLIAQYEANRVTPGIPLGTRGKFGEGELPFRVGSGWTTHSADLRNDTARFATLDYSDEAPRVYLGEAVDVPGLKLRGLREFEGWR